MKIQLHRWIGVAGAWLGITSASAYDFKVDGIYYDINADETTVSVTYKTENSYASSYSGEVAIPQSVTYNKKNYSVTNIGERAFYLCSGLTSITIPESVASIGSWAFSNCTGLTSIIIPESVTSIGDQAFLCCTGLTSIIIPNSVTTIGRQAFLYCFGLTSITIPKSVASIGNQAFSDCSGLQSIVVTEENTSYSSSEGVLFNKDKTALIQYPGGKSGAYMIPSSVTSIEPDAFRGCTGLTEVTIPNSVTTIGDFAFLGCHGLASVTIPNSVTTIGSGAFHCFDLQSIVVAEENMSYSSSEGVLFNKDKTVLIQYPRRKSGAYVIPSGVTTIGDYAFDNCTGLTSIIIPESVITIEEGAFYYCTGLTEVTIGESVTTIGAGAFSGCTGLTSVTIPESVTTIGFAAFENCTGLTSITIPEGVTSIGSGAFYNCTGLQSIVVAEGNASYSSSEGVLFNKDKTVLIQYPGGKSGAYAIPSGVTAIGAGTFSGCTGLTSVTIPNSVTIIGESAFSSCSGLTSITIPNSVTTIGRQAFSGCDGLTEVTIGESITSIGDLAFLSCTSLETIKSYATIPPAIEANTFGSYNATLYVPVDCGEAYREAEYWANFTNIVESLDSRVEALQDENARVYTVGNTLHVENGGKVYQVYTLAGQLVYTGNDTIIPLDNPGIYIVRTGERSQKVIVK